MSLILERDVDGGRPVMAPARPVVRTALRFGAVGLVGVVVNETLLHALHVWAQAPVTFAAIAATEAAILINYTANELWTFGLRPDAGRLVRYQLTSLAGLVISLVTLQVLLAVTPLRLLVANLVAIAAATTWNFAVNFTWTWSRQ